MGASSGACIRSKRPRPISHILAPRGTGHFGPAYPVVRLAVLTPCWIPALVVVVSGVCCFTLSGHAGSDTLHGRRCWLPRPRQ